MNKEVNQQVPGRALKGVLFSLGELLALGCEARALQGATRAEGWGWCVQGVWQQARPSRSAWSLGLPPLVENGCHPGLWAGWRSGRIP